MLHSLQCYFCAPWYEKKKVPGSYGVVTNCTMILILYYAVWLPDFVMKHTLYVRAINQLGSNDQRAILASIRAGWVRWRSHKLARGTHCMPFEL